MIIGGVSPLLVLVGMHYAFFPLSFNDLALKLTHFLFELYIDNNKIENIQLLISKYYDLYQSTQCNEEIIVYYNDMGTFFMKTEEYHEAISYFSRTREI